MRRVQDAVHHRVAHVQVRRRHVDLRAQHAATVRKLALLHPLEQIEILFDANDCDTGYPCPARVSVPRCCADLVGRQIVNIRLAILDELDRPLVELIESSPTRRNSRRPSRSQPADVLLIESTYSCSSFSGFVSSKRRLVLPPNSSASPKSRQMHSAWPICRYPFGSGGNASGPQHRRISSCADPQRYCRSKNSRRLFPEFRFVLVVTAILLSFHEKSLICLIRDVKAAEGTSSVSLVTLQRTFRR